MKVANAGIALKRKFRRGATDAQKQSPMEHLLLNRDVLELQMIAVATLHGSQSQSTTALNQVMRTNSATSIRRS